MAERPRGPKPPNAVITGIIQEALRDGVNISTSRAASVSVLNATSCANSFAMRGKLKTLNASDVLSAMEETELKEALEGYRREQKGKKEASEQKKDKDKTKLIRKSRTSAVMRTTIKGAAMLGRS
uniref:Uncharacterized protein n=1 Tax=Capra hircus TaxID=9925 RepID=A0A8C2NPN3_CAPHI